MNGYGIIDMSKRLHYAVTSIIGNEGINCIVRRTILINNDTSLLMNIKNDLKREEKEGIYNIYYDDKDDNIIELHYFIENESDAIVPYYEEEDEDELDTLIIRCDDKRAKTIAITEDIVWNNQDKIIHYLLAAEIFQDESYPEFKMDKICVKTLEEFKAIVWCEINKIYKKHKQFNFQRYYVHFIIEGEDNGTWRELQI